MPDDKRKAELPKPGVKSAVNLPYEHALLKAFDKLTSEIFIFLLAYLILVVGVAWLVPTMSSSLQVLLHVLPVLGIAGYLWLHSGSLVKTAESHGVEVRSGLALGSARVAGALGLGGRPDRVKVKSGIAAGNAQVIGSDSSGITTPEDKSDDEQYLLHTFRQLDPAERRQVLTRMLRILDERGIREDPSQ